MSIDVSKLDLSQLHAKLLAIVRYVAESSNRKENLHRLTPDFPLFGGTESLGLDSLDILDIALEVEKEFGISFHEEEDQAEFATVSSLAQCLRSRFA